MRWGCVLLLVGSGCDRVLGLGDVQDARPSCMSTLTTGAYSTPTLVFANQGSPSLSADQTLMYTGMNGVISYSRYDGTWSPPVPIPSLDDQAYVEERPNLSYDGQLIYITRHPNASSGNSLPYVATRVGDEEWTPATPVSFPPVIGGNDVIFGVPSADGNRVVVAHGPASFFHLTELARAGTGWSVLDTMAALYPMDNDVNDSHGQLSPDGCWVVFPRIDHKVPASNREIMFANRGLDGRFGPAQKLFPTTTPQDEINPWLAPDGATVYFTDHSNDSTYVARRQ